MPHEISDPDEFLKIAEQASECRVKRLGDMTKLKLRLPHRLYTIKLETPKANEMLEKLKCPKKEL